MTYSPAGRVAFAITALLLVANVALPASSDPYDRGRQALDGKNYAEADRELEQAEATQPGATDALALRAKALIHLNRFEDAEDCLRRYLQRHPESPDATYLLAYVLFRRNEPSDSLQMYTAAARLQRPKPDDFKIIGLNYVLLNDNLDAVKWLRQSVSENRDDPETLYYLGRAYYVQNSFDQAIEAFDGALKLQPGLVKAQDNLGLAYEGKNDLRSAEAAYRRAIDLSTSNGAPYIEAYVNLADLLRRLGRNDEALSFLDTADRLAAPSKRSHEVRARVLFAAGRLPEAEKQVRAAVAIDPQNRALHYLLGRILKGEGKSAEADGEFEETRKLLQ